MSYVNCFNHPLVGAQEVARISVVEASIRPKTQSYLLCKGSHDAALRRARFGREQVSILDVTGFQPLAKHSLVRGDMLEHPLVTDVVEAAFDVALQHPLR